MPVADVLLERYVHRAIVAAVKAALPSTLVLEVGMRRNKPETGPSEWVSVDPLAFEPFDSRRDTYDGTELFQVACFARYAEANGGELDAPQRLAGAVRAALEKQDIVVKKVGESVETFLGTLKLRAAGRQYLGEGAIGIDYPANVHAVILTFRGTLNAG